MISTNKLRKAMREIAAAKGDFTFFGIFLRADALGTWDLVVSAPWLEERRLKPLGEFTELLRLYMTLVEVSAKVWTPSNRNEN